MVAPPPRRARIMLTIACALFALFAIAHLIGHLQPPPSPRHAALRQAEEEVRLEMPFQPSVADAIDALDVAVALVFFAFAALAALAARADGTSARTLAAWLAGTAGALAVVFAAHALGPPALFAGLAALTSAAAVPRQTS